MNEEIWEEVARTLPPLWSGSSATTPLARTLVRVLVSAPSSFRPARASVRPFMTTSGASVSPQRVRLLSEDTKTVAASKPGGIVYWMSRDQRVQDNWALLHAKQLAERDSLPLSVVFCLVPKFLQATIRQYGFMLRGLEEVDEELRKLNIPFVLLQGEPGERLPAFLIEHEAAALVTDFSPLRVPITWKQQVSSATTSTANQIVTVTQAPISSPRPRH